MYVPMQVEDAYAEKTLAFEEDRRKEQKVKAEKEAIEAEERKQKEEAEQEEAKKKAEEEEEAAKQAEEVTKQTTGALPVHEAVSLT